MVESRLELDVGLEEHRYASLIHRARCSADWASRKPVYPKHGTETISIVPYLFGQPSILTINLEVARQIISPKGMDWIKSEQISAPLT